VNDATYKRLMAYATALSTMMVAEPTAVYGSEAKGQNSLQK